MSSLVSKGFFRPKQKLFDTDQQQVKLEPLLPKHQRSPKGGPKRISHRDIFKALSACLRTGARWNHLADR